MRNYFVLPLDKEPISLASPNKEAKKNINVKPNFKNSQEKLFLRKGQELPAVSAAGMNCPKRCI